MRAAAILAFLLLAIGCSQQQRFSRAYRTAPLAAVEPKLALPLVVTNIYSNIEFSLTLNYNSTPPTIMVYAPFQASNAPWIFEATTNLSDWWRIPKTIYPETRQIMGQTAMFPPSTFIRLRLLP